MTIDHSETNNCQCEICRNNLPFEIPANLLKDIIKSKAVIFAGAGISTENHLVFPLTLYEDICQTLGIDNNKSQGFADLMTFFCANGNGRRALLQKIKKRFDYINSFPELYRMATQFHQELSSIYFFDTFITTNWDDYFEKECGALPIVNAEDYAFWDIADRKVFKIHGSIDSYSSIIATRDDYERCYNNLSTGLIGSNLKLLLATKTMVYIGFSFRDDDFLRIYSLLSKEMGEIHQFSYIVTLDQNSDDRFKELGLIPIYTSGEYFISQIKKELVLKGMMLDDCEFDSVDSFLFSMSEFHKKFTGTIDVAKNPGAIYSISFQDGLIHALERIMTMKNTGYYSNPNKIIGSIEAYNSERKRNLHEKRYFDVSYIDGYIQGLSYLLYGEDSQHAFSPFYIFGYKGKINNMKDYKKILKNSDLLHKASYKSAKAYLSKMNIDKSIVIHHKPFL